jgi:hypothetical protein
VSNNARPISTRPSEDLAAVVDAAAAHSSAGAQFIGIFIIYNNRFLAIVLSSINFFSNCPSVSKRRFQQEIIHCVKSAICNRRAIKRSRQRGREKKGLEYEEEGLEQQGLQ